jgi:hypothetical protein
VLYRLVRDRGELPYAGRHLARAGGRRSRLLEPLRTPLASIQVAGETEGRARAAARVTGAALGLLGNRLVRIAVAAGKAPLWLAGPRRRDPEGLVGRGYAALDRARQTASARAPLLALALRRPRPTRAE